MKIEKFSFTNMKTDFALPKKKILQRQKIAFIYISISTAFKIIDPYALSLNLLSTILIFDISHVIVLQTEKIRKSSFCKAIKILEK